MENNLDELKTQWGWCGYATQDLLRCQIAVRNIALLFNWWSLFARLADPSKRRKAITSRPLLLGAVARQTTHAGQVSITISPFAWQSHSNPGIVKHTAPQWKHAVSLAHRPRVSFSAQGQARVSLDWTFWRPDFVASLLLS